ncbi:MAG: hypothetical protein FJ020_09600 [Chloroflexi bacterium]|nr:hypothetical protein [Chloroflexota bacterium]
MSDFSWQIDDPILESINYARDDAGFWNVSIALKEAQAGSLAANVVSVKLKAHGQDVAQTLWPVAGSRQEGQAAETVLTFQTGSKTYPLRARVVIALAQK